MSRWVVRRFGRGPAGESEQRPKRLGWRAALRAATAIVHDQPGLVAVGLLGFLARGGALLFILPIVVLPTPTGLSNFIGSQALTAGGPSQGLVWLIASALAGTVALIIAGSVIGAAADVLLLGAAVAFQRRGQGEIDGPRPDVTSVAWPSLVLTRGLLLRVSLIRLLWMVPVALAAVWGTSRLVAAAYHQLILPDDLTVPLAFRVLRDAADAAAVVAATWLVGETFSGLAIRRLIVSEGSILGALGWAIVAPFRRPLTTAATLALGTVGLVLAVGPPVLLANLLWRRLQVLLDGDQSAFLTVVATIGLVAAWVFGLLLVGSIATWRSLAWSFEVLRAGRRAEVPARTERPFDPPSMARAGARPDPAPVVRG